MRERLKQIIYKLPLGTLRNYIGTEIAIGFIERVLTRADVNEVYYMIENDIYNIVDLNKHKNNPRINRALQMTKRILKENEDIIRKVVTYENIVNVLRASRPDILSLIINHPKGKEWLKKAIDETLNFLLS